ncbi:MAG: protein-S-isoprenylcysteine O-methyltransferase [Bacteroidota bacterium]
MAYGVVLVGTYIIRYPHEKRNKANQITNNQKAPLEMALVGFVFLGMMVLPVLYLFTSLFAFANFSLPLWANVLGLFLILPTLWLFYRSHKDLGRNWSVSLEIRDGHHIIDTGVYRLVRHPMYSAIWLWCIVQFLLLNNYIAGFSGMLAFGLLYFIRVPKEEAMLKEEFGADYLDYMSKTKRIIPYLL